MYKYLKLIFALSIFCCLFLPLSQCSYPKFSEVKSPPSEMQRKSPTDAAVKWETVVFKLNNIPKNLEGLCVSLALILPLLFCFIVPKTYKLKIAAIVLQTGVTIWLLYLVYALVFSFEPLYGGYILAISSALYFTSTIYEWYLIVGKKIKSA